MKFEDLSARAKNVCLDNDLSSVDELIEFINDGRKLFSLRNCGKKTIYELETLISSNTHEKHESNNPSYNKPTQLASLYSLIRDNELKRDVFNDNFNSQLNNLSVRSKNAFLLIVGNDNYQIDSFIQKAIISNISFESLKNVGKRASGELENFREKIKEIIYTIAKQKIDKYDHLLKIIESNLGFGFNEIDGSFEDLKASLRSKQFDLIKFFDHYILNYFFERELDKLLLIRLLSEDNEELSFDEISKKVGLHRERVRQISLKHLKSRRFIFLSKLLFYCEGLSNNIELESFSKVEISEEKHNKKLNYLTYNSTTLARIISLITNDFSLIFSGEELGAINKGKDIHNRDFYKKFKVLKSNYIFSKEFINKEFCLEILVDIFRRNCEKVQNDYYFNPFSKFNLNYNQKEFIVKLISENFNLYETDKGFEIKKNTKITLIELIIEVLKRADEPLLISEIYESIESEYPGKCKSEDALRGTVNRFFKERIIYLRGASGRKTLYGLKEWENTKELKAGSIKQLCIDYLNNQENPIHLLELSRFIIKHRETNPHNILGNLKLDPHNNFTYFKSGFIGLIKKTYNKDFTKSIKSIGAQSYKILEFVKNNIYYDYTSLINKFSKEFDVYPIQIEQAIYNGIENDIINKKGNKIYYNSIQEDSIVRNLFSSNNDVKISGYNPYRVLIDDLKFVIKIKQNLSNDVSLSERDFQNDGFHGSGYYSEFRTLIIYNPSLLKYRAYLWFGEIDLNKVNLNFKFSSVDEFSVLTLDSSTNIIDFTRSRLEKFLMLLNLLLESNMVYNDFKIDGKSINMSYLNVNDLSELDAITKIINEANNKFNVELDISQSREIYQRIKISKS